MPRSHSQELIIDASVAQAAGPEGAIHPTAKQCRDFLLAVRDNFYRAVFSVAIAEEWNQHQSRFAREWRTSMFARKLIDRPIVTENAEFRLRIGELAESDAVKEAMIKDAHLIEAALMYGQRIASLDEQARDCLRQLAPDITMLQTICWVNPNREEENPRQWLESGAPLEQARTLGGPSWI